MSTSSQIVDLEVVKLVEDLKWQVERQLESEFAPLSSSDDSEEEEADELTILLTPVISQKNASTPIRPVTQSVVQEQTEIQVVVQDLVVHHAGDGPSVAGRDQQQEPEKSVGPVFGPGGDFTPVARKMTDGQNVVRCLFKTPDKPPVRRSPATRPVDGTPASGRKENMSPITSSVAQSGASENPLLRKLVQGHVSPVAPVTPVRVDPTPGPSGSPVAVVSPVFRRPEIRVSNVKVPGLCRSDRRRPLHPHLYNEAVRQQIRDRAEEQKRLRKQQKDREKRERFERYRRFVYQPPEEQEMQQMMEQEDQEMDDYEVDDNDSSDEQ